MKIGFDNSYARLPDRFYAALPPVPVSRPVLIRLNEKLATDLGLDPQWLSGKEGTDMLAGNRVPPDSQPIATAYAGHQFGSWNPQLGDGRAILLGEIRDPAGRRFDLQLKGSGPTPWSRGGDGRSPLGPVIREYLLSEAMAALGIPTTRSLAAVSSGDTVIREEMLPGAILCRVASSHIRVGTVQYFASRGDIEGLQILVDHVIDRHYPEARESDEPVAALLDAVVSAQARLIARWQLVGFIHGVMNTDNMLLCGETVDYGPCAFMDSFHPDTVYSSIDHGGRYAYRNQPSIAHWNLAALAQALLPLMGEEQETALERAQSAVDAFPAQFLAAHQEGMAAKLGLVEVHEEDEELVSDLLALMSEEKTDFSLAFRRLADLASPDTAVDQSVEALLELPPSFDNWLERWHQRLESDPQQAASRQAGMYEANPVFIPRNHLVEAAIRAASDSGDFEPFHDLVERLQTPAVYNAADIDYARPPRPEQEVRQTFCGT